MLTSRLLGKCRAASWAQRGGVAGSSPPEVMSTGAAARTGWWESFGRGPPGPTPPGASRRAPLGPPPARSVAQAVQDAPVFLCDPRIGRPAGRVRGAIVEQDLHGALEVSRRGEIEAHHPFQDRAAHVMRVAPQVDHRGAGAVGGAEKVDALIP